MTNDMVGEILDKLYQGGYEIAPKPPVIKEAKHALIEWVQGKRRSANIYNWNNALNHLCDSIDEKWREWYGKESTK